MYVLQALSLPGASRHALPRVNIPASSGGAPTAPKLPRRIAASSIPQPTLNPQPTYQPSLQPLYSSLPTQRHYLPFDPLQQNPAHLFTFCSSTHCSAFNERAREEDQLSDARDRYDSTKGFPFHLHLYPKRALLEGAEVDIFKLLSYGATPEQWREWLRAPLEHAAARGDYGLVEKLLNVGADGGTEWSGCRGRTLLDAAALGGNPDVVAALLRSGFLPDVDLVSVSSGRSALHLSAVCGHEAVARKLILAGAHANRVD